MLMSSPLSLSEFTSGFDTILRPMAMKQRLRAVVVPRVDHQAIGGKVERVRVPPKQR